MNKSNSQTWGKGVFLAVPLSTVGLEFGNSWILLMGCLASTEQERALLFLQPEMLWHLLDPWRDFQGPFKVQRAENVTHCLIQDVL